MIDEYLKNWLIKAKNDLKVVENEIVLPPEDMVTDAICFHSQQAVEKYLKANLIFKQIEFDKSHNLEYLLEICIETDNEFSQVEVGNLSFYAVEVRYPDDFYIPTEQEAKECTEIARKVKEFVFEKLNINDSDIESSLTSDEEESEVEDTEENENSTKGDP